MSARVAVFQERCPARAPEGRHAFRRAQLSREQGILKVRRCIRLRCVHCQSVLRVESRWERRPL